MANNTISYALRENLLTADPDACMAQVVDARTYTQEDITKEMVKRGTSLTETDIATYQKLEVEVYKDSIVNGGAPCCIAPIQHGVSRPYIPLYDGHTLRCMTVIQGNVWRTYKVMYAGAGA